MQDHLLTEITGELRTKLAGRFLGKIFQLGPMSFAIDFGLKGEFLLISVEPSSPRLYLINRRLKELEKAAVPQATFAQQLRSKLSGARILNIEKTPNDRIVRITSEPDDETGEQQVWTLVIQLTGRASNLFLLDENERIVDVLRPDKNQSNGDIYQAPESHKQLTQTEETLPSTAESPSATADAYFQKLDGEKIFDVRAKKLRARLQQKLKQKQKLRTNLQNDLQSHGDAEEHRRLGDLLLANVGTAVRRGHTVEISDYYTEGAPPISIQIDDGVTLQEEAARKFRQYTKAKRAREEIIARLGLLETEIAILEQDDEKLQQIIDARDETALSELDHDEAPTSQRVKKQAEPARIPGVRHYVSSDGYEILVGRGARDNDNLTFRVARPNDLWLHAADYPGSHVVVRNPTRKEIPQRTMIEAAQLAGKFSQAGEDSKVVVHYTQRKFLAKPKGVAPGLVRMSTFRSITVEPKEAVSRLR
jgi:predicted ribosome quality control (RQC) complex YloA/Tae2 family protein